MQFSYQGLYRVANTLGSEVRVRNGLTREVLSASLQVPADVLVKRVGGLNRALGYMELMQLVAGKFDLEALKRVAPRADHSLFTDVMAYGPRTWELGRSQFAMVIRELTGDPSSRRAIVNLGLGSEFPWERTCTQVLQFIIRNGRLDSHIYMRSWDLWWGAPYDLVMFCGVTQLLAHCLGIKHGQVVVTAGSAHIYEPFWDKETTTDSDYFRLEEGLPRDWFQLVSWARDNVNDQLWVKGPPVGVVEMSLADWIISRNGDQQG